MDKTCVICWEKEATTTICDTPRGGQCQVCSKCADLSENNFLLKCVHCGCATTIERSKHNIARVAKIMLTSQGAYISDLHLNLMFIAVQKERPTIITLNYCPHCIKKESVGAKKKLTKQCLTS